MPYANIEHGRAQRREYQKSEAGKARHVAANAAYRARNRKKLTAHNAVSKALLRGKLVKRPCFVCDEQTAEAHHPDYDRPLDVVWLCNSHHKAAHAIVRLHNKQNQ